MVSKNFRENLRLATLVPQYWGRALQVLCLVKVVERIPLALPGCSHTAPNHTHTHQWRNFLSKF